MTVATTERKQSFTTNGVTVDFPFTFKATDANQIYCQYTPSGGNTIDYTNFTVVLQEAGGTVTTNDVLGSGTLLVYRIVPLTQNTDYVEGGRFPAESHEAALDKLTLIDQDQQEDISRALKGPIGKDNPYTLAETLTEDELLIMQTNEIKSSGTTIDDLNNAIDNANNAAQNAEKVLINLPSGQWASGITFNSANEFMNFNGVGYTPLPTTAFPYETQGNDPTQAPDNAFVQPFSNINSSNLPTYTDIVFDSVADMKSSTIQHTAGNQYKVGSSLFVVVAEVTNFPLVGGLYAKILQVGTILDWGAKGDWNGTTGTDDTQAAVDMLADTRQLVFKGKNRITATLSLDDIYQCSIRGGGMGSSVDQMIIDHDDEDVFSHGGAAFGNEFLTIEDLHVVKNFSGSPVETQHFYTPRSPSSWKRFKNIQIQDLGGTFHRYPGGSLDAYSQRIEIENLRLWRCGGFSCITGDDTVEKFRPVCTISYLRDIDFKDGRGTSYSKYTYDLRGWRQIESDSTLETGYGASGNPENLIAFFGFRTNSDCRFGTFWYEAAASGTPANMFHFDVNPPSTVDGDSGATITFKNIESTRQSPLAKFEANTAYNIKVESLGSIYSWFIPPSQMLDIPDQYTNKNTCEIDLLYWRAGASGIPLLPVPLPNNLHGVLNIRGLTTKANNNYVPPINMTEPEIIYEWSSDGTIKPDDASLTNEYFNVDLSVNVDTNGYANYLGSLALNIGRNTGGVPRIRYNLNAGLFAGSWFTIAIDYVNRYSGTGQIGPQVISNSNADSPNAIFANENNQNGSGYSTAYAFVQVDKDTRLDAFASGPDVGNGECNFYLRSIRAYRGLVTKSGLTFK